MTYFFCSLFHSMPLVRAATQCDHRCLGPRHRHRRSRHLEMRILPLENLEEGSFALTYFPLDLSRETTRT